MGVPAPFSGALTTTCVHCGAKLLTVSGLWAVADEDDPRAKALAGLSMECSCPGAVAAEEERQARMAADYKTQQEAKRAARFANDWAESGMAQAWKERGLSKWERKTRSQQDAYAAAAAFGKAHSAGQARSLFVVGDIGTGKTYLCSCLAADLLRRGKRVCWTNVSDVLRDIRESYNQTRVSEADVIRKYTCPAVLVLDDLGKEKPSEWALTQLFSVVNSRYDAGRPIIVTTNYGGADLVKRLTPKPDFTGWEDDTTARAIVDRLRAMSVVIKLEGRSCR